jgi:hypothetical protein
MSSKRVSVYLAQIRGHVSSLGPRAAVAFLLCCVRRQLLPWRQISEHHQGSLHGELDAAQSAWWGWCRSSERPSISIGPRLQAMAETGHWFHAQHGAEHTIALIDTAEDLLSDEESERLRVAEIERQESELMVLGRGFDASREAKLAVTANDPLFGKLDLRVQRR